MLGRRFVPGDVRASVLRLLRASIARLRAAAVLLAVIVVALAWSVRSAEAQLGEALVDFGDQLQRWSAGRALSAPRALTINGLELRLMTLQTKLSVDAALDHFQETCRGGIQAPELAGKLDSSLLDASFQQVGEKEGVLACVDTGGPLDVADLAGRLSRLQQSGDLAELGALRYVLARRSRDTTTLLVLWTEGRTRLLDFLPKQGDAPGHDLRDWPRAPRIRRLLSALEHGQPYAMTVHEAVDQSPESVLSWYRTALGAAGWSLTEQEGGLLAHRGERSVLLQVRASRTGKAVVTAAALS
jgi:hypothetical protein